MKKKAFIIEYDTKTQKPSLQFAVVTSNDGLEFEFVKKASEPIEDIGISGDFLLNIATEEEIDNAKELAIEMFKELLEK